MLARLRARGAVPGFLGVRAASPTVRRPQLTGSLTLRVLSGLVAVPLLLFIAFIGEPVYAVFLAIATAYAALEVRSMLRSAGYTPLDWLLVGLSAALPLATRLQLDTTLLVALALVASLASLLVRQWSERILLEWSLSFGLALYLGGFMLYYVPLRDFPSLWPGFWVMALLVLSWVCDSSAFFVGRAIGRTPLAPAISPKKSVEGAAAGLVAPAIVGLVAATLLHLNPLLGAGYGLVIALGTIVGDLVESLLKRQTGVKDSGVLIPGHGGLLDRMDSLLLCAPLAVLYLSAVRNFWL
ncbi:MAG: phosphatidate cytidylyltransferase [Chloroflexi bacterium]|nr:phosphatidate cytidylyltransferase [Chloroflexota bacterium]